LLKSKSKSDTKVLIFDIKFYLLFKLDYILLQLSCINGMLVKERLNAT
jgi:hypothetical protein